jgi:penicillin-binding protein 2
MKRHRFGHAFGSEVAKISSKSSYRVHDVEEATYWERSGEAALSNWRRIALLAVVIIAFFGLFLRLFHLQVSEGKNWRVLADSNRIQVRVIHAPRGVIYDMNGKILSQNEPGFRLVDSSPSAQIHSRLVSRDEALKMEVNNDPRFQELEIDSLRSYPMGEVASHILGYMGEITSDELKDPKFSNYKLGDQIGRGGVEESYEKTLKGKDGGEVIEVDSAGNKIRTLNRIDPIPGQNLYLTVDADLQKVVYKALSDQVKKVGACCGAVVATDPKSGQILALASYPSFDPADLNKALLDQNSPLLNRVIGGTYPPGSTFKIASSLAGLSSNKINPKDTVEDTGIISLGAFTFANWYYTEYGRKEGMVDMLKAIQRSNDIYYYHLGEVVGEKILSDTSKKLGLGEILGIDIPGEVKGLIPDNDWKEANVGESWFPGDTLHMSIGQGFVLTTPLQVHNLISVVAADGRRYPPHLAYKITSPTGKLVKQFKFDNYSASPFKQTDINLIKQGLELVPKNGGTAWPFFTFTVPTAGKTGTAEFGDPKDKTHAWYTSYAPSQDPKIAVTAMVEAGGEGSSTAAPIVKEIYRWYFSKDKNKLDNFESVPVSTESAKILGE